MAKIGSARFLYVIEKDSIVPIAMITVPTEEFWGKLATALNIKLEKECDDEEDLND